MFLTNLKRRITAVAILISQVEKKGISTTAKSAYCRAAIILICSIIEGLVYHIVKKSIGSSPYIIEKRNNYIQLQDLGSNINSEKKLCVCEKKNVDISIDDTSVGFGKLILYLKNKKIVTEKQYIVLEKVRKERNRIHVQSLESPDTGYSKKKMILISSALPILISKL